ncbi:MAG: hypothetical protein IPG79_01485 [Saprospiraceae bacterium]|nr:hypothetical protein [Saprospiraceae bacterium]
MERHRIFKERRNAYCSLDNITSPVINRINFDAGSNNNFNISDLDGDGDADIISASASGSSFYIINGVFISNACPSGSVFFKKSGASISLCRKIWYVSCHSW